VPKKTYVQALAEAMAEEFERDERVFCMATTPPQDLLTRFGPTRARRIPISEAASTGLAVGAAACGYRPVVIWRNITFAFVAMDQVVNQASKIRYMFGGQATVPIVFRAYSGGGLRLGAQHSQSPYSMYMHVPGLKVVAPSTPADAKGLLKSAIRDDNPVVSLECSRLDPLEDDVPDGDVTVPLGVAGVKRVGTDVTVIAVGYMVHLALAAAEELAKDGASVEVVDPRTLVPLDHETIRKSVHKTGRVVIVDEAPPTCSAAAEIATVIVEDADTFARLKTHVRRVCAANAPVPYSPPLEDYVLPDQARVLTAVRATLDA
jgi:pyruvate/2-oxoglutarate/acetoin dehydrogenase E1 component